MRRGRHRANRCAGRCARRRKKRRSRFVSRRSNRSARTRTWRTLTGGKRHRTSALAGPALALMLVLGLLAGFAAGGTSWAAAMAVPAGRAATTTAASPSPTAPAGRPDRRRPTGRAGHSRRSPPVAGGVPPPKARGPPLPGAAAARRGRATAGATPSVVRAARGQLVVRSTPSRAAVTINGRWRGRTPLTLDNLPFGSYTVRVVQPGYRSRTRGRRAEREQRVAHVRAAPRARAAARRRRCRSGAAARTPPARPGWRNLHRQLFVDSRPQGRERAARRTVVGKTPLQTARKSDRHARRPHRMAETGHGRRPRAVTAGQR